MAAPLCFPLPSAPPMTVSELHPEIAVRSAQRSSASRRLVIVVTYHVSPRLSCALARPLVQTMVCWGKQAQREPDV
jgi:hypothetical protein